MVPLKYLNNFWRTFEMSPFNCEINRILTWPANCVVYNAANNKTATFAITGTKRCVPVVTVVTIATIKIRIQTHNYLEKFAKVKDYNVMIDQPIKSYIKTNEDIRKITTGQGDDYTTGCLRDYNYIKKQNDSNRFG